MELPDLSGEITKFGKFLYEELISHLMMYKYFDVIEKNYMIISSLNRREVFLMLPPICQKKLGKIRC